VKLRNTTPPEKKALPSVKPNEKKKKEKSRQDPKKERSPPGFDAPESSFSTSPRTFAWRKKGSRPTSQEKKLVIPQLTRIVTPQKKLK